ncbi:VanZ family protein [Ningiella sp. W23]|uniref:VanZ family protein n=1 Tax=Ningiella sp. W23 TaxID=3023715 RepID=UPI00375710AF
MHEAIAANVRQRILLATLAYLLFVIYGSLVPLNFNDVSVSEAISIFASLDKLDFAIDPDKRADWFTNFLLMAPLFYCAMLLKSGEKNVFKIFLYSVLVIAGIGAISIAIEFAQLFIDRRTTSFKDVYAQGLGILLTLLIFAVTKARAHALLLKMSSEQRSDKWQVYGIVIITILFIYSLMPFDLSLSFTELTKKWADGRISTIPFYEITRKPISGSLSIIIDILIWAAITWCYIKSDRFHPQKTTMFLMLTAIAIELAQLPVLSRFTDITDVIAAFVGIVIARKLFHSIERGTSSSNGSAEHGESRAQRLSFYAIIAYFGFFFVLLGLYTFPIEVVNRGQFWARVDGFFSIPFLAYWADEPFVAITQLVRKTALFIPLGLLVQFYRHKAKASTLHYVFVLMLTFAAISALELTQLLMANKVASVSDTLLNVFGFCLGLTLYRSHQTRQPMQHKTRVAVNQIRSEQALSSRHDMNAADGVSTSIYSTKKTPELRRTQAIRPIVISFIGMTLLLAVALWVLLSLDATPYNVKEVFDKYPAPLSPLFISFLFVSLAFAPLVVIGRANRLGRLYSKDTLLACVIIGLSISIGAHIVFPHEALWDVVGFPVWNFLPHPVEIIYRFFALTLPFVFLYVVIASDVCAARNLPRSLNYHLILYSAWAMLVVPFSYLVVVVQAGTDNLTELMKNNGYSIALLGFAFYPPCILISSRMLVKLFSEERASASFASIVTGVIFICASGPVGHWLISISLVDLVFKYNTVFTPLQFLFSPDRESLLLEQTTFYIFLGLHYLLLIVIAVVFAMQHHLAQLSASFVPVSNHSNKFKPSTKPHQI